MNQRADLWEGGWYRAAQREPSPNFGERPPGAAVDLLVLHNYSFIGVQVKTSMGSYYQEVAKTAASFFVQKCLKHAGCLIGHHHTGCMTDLEYEEVVRNQLSLILCIDKDKIINKTKGI